MILGTIEAGASYWFTVRAVFDPTKKWYTNDTVAIRHPIVLANLCKVVSGLKD